MRWKQFVEYLDEIRSLARAFPREDVVPIDSPIVQGLVELAVKAQEAEPPIEFDKIPVASQENRGFENDARPGYRVADHSKDKGPQEKVPRAVPIPRNAIDAPPPSRVYKVEEATEATVGKD